MYFSTTLILLLVVVNILVYYLQKPSSSSSSLGKRPINEEDHGEKNDSSSSLLKQRSMASSSSSSNFNSASDSHSWKYEVFISFRGEDTRKGFVDHLYTALVQQGIVTYKDDVTLPRGAAIGPALIKAIQESRIAVIVFSRNYANSSWCLDELAHIVKCMENKGQIVMPVFYNVDPSDVRKQQRKYGEAFTKHECENKHRVKLWREALAKAGKLSGWVPKDFANGHEAKCIRDIVATIFNRLSPLISNVNKDLIGIEARLQNLKSMLKIGSGGVRMVGIWGVGGGGKTTLASAAYMELSPHFEACCLLENIRESSKHGLKKLQANLLSPILKRDVSVASVIEGKSMIERSLRHKIVLVVLDDVDDLNQLDALAGSHDWFGKGSRIIITTRDEHLLTRKADMVYEVSLLSHDEAIKLFRKHAYWKDKPVEEYEKLSQDVVSYAGGLPLALEILGSFLYDKDKDEWRSVLAKLKRIPYPEVTKRLKISYDGLEPDEKQLFLDIACFYRRVLIDEAMPVLDTCNFQLHIGIKVLVQKSLIKESNGRFDMHDLVEEMAHYIVRGEHSDYPEKLSRIWKEVDVVNLCAMGAVVSETQVLAFRDYHLNDNHPRLLDVIGNMNKLRWIEWSTYPASTFPSNFQPIKLGCLMLRHSNLKQLWEGNKILPNLKILDLGYSNDLTATPDFRGLPRLERLILEYCRSLKEIHPSIGYHKSLVFVNMRMCGKLTTFPPIIRMKNLETLDLFRCTELQIFPDIQTNMDSLVNLHLGRTIINLVPPSVGQFCTNLVSFNLNNCIKLKRIEGNFRLLKCLKYLKISGCIQLEKLERDFFGNECCLEERPQYPWLSRKLNLSYCTLGDGDMPSDWSEFINLQVLDLSGNIFSRLPSSLSKIPCLKFLNLSDCPNLVELPDLPSSIAILIADCRSLQSVGDLSNCKWLWKVSLYIGHTRVHGSRRVRYATYERGRESKLIGVESIQSMVQKNVVEDRFMSILLPRSPLLVSCSGAFTMTLQLPHNWYNDFSGFLVFADDCDMYECRIYIKQEMLFMDSQPYLDHYEEFVKNPESYKECQLVGYVPFGSLRHTSWWNLTFTQITFRIKGLSNPKVGLVPRISKSRETPIHYSKYWEEDIEGKKTFQIIDNPKSSEIEIRWSPKI